MLLTLKAIAAKAWANITWIALSIAAGTVWVLHWMLGRAKEREEEAKKAADEANYRAAGAEAAVKQQEEVHEAVSKVTERQKSDPPPDFKKPW